VENLALYILIALIGFALLLNIAATYIVFRTYFEVKNRRLYQMIFIWLLPILGSSLCIFINKEDYFAQKNQKQVGNNPGVSESQAVSFGAASNHRGGR
jgi:hypothetical protein